MSTGRVATVTPSIAWYIKDGDDNVISLAKAAFLSAISVTESVIGTQVIGTSTTEALDFGSISSAKAAMVWVEADSDVSTMAIEVNDSDDDTFTCTCWFASGGAGITGIEVTNASGADDLTISFAIFE